MKPEKILYALNDIDSEFLNEARAKTAPRHSRKFAALIAAVIALTAMTLTAFAADEIAGWFKQYFTKQSDLPLTPGQIEFIEENEQVINNTQTYNGYTIQLKSAIGSGNTTYISLELTAPDDINLLQWGTLIFSKNPITDDQGHFPQLVKYIVQDNQDGLDNTVSVILVLEQESLTPVTEWNIAIDSIYGENYDREYEQELLRTKYAGQLDITSYTNDEWAKILSKTLLAEGNWNFTVAVKYPDFEELEMLKEPIQIRTIYTCPDPLRNGSSYPMTITSFVLRPMDASLYYQCHNHCSDNHSFTTIYSEPFCHIVMKDGTQVAFRRSISGSDQEYRLVADSPIVLSEVDHVLLSDGTKLTVP